MIGLHCCGDLTQDMMKIFCSIKELKAFVCIGCCYNKININGKQFPLFVFLLNKTVNLHFSSVDTIGFDTLQYIETLIYHEQTLELQYVLLLITIKLIVLLLPMLYSIFIHNIIFLVILSIVL